ncbi:hypothetical protein D9M70_398790 [compost metagenome]
MGDHLAGFQRMLLPRRVAGQQMEIHERHLALALRPLQVDRCANGHHGDTHVGRMRGDAVRAATEHRVHIAVEAFDGGAARAGVALVARRDPIAEISAPHPLHHVAGGRGLVAQLGAGTGQQCLRQRGIVLADMFVTGQVGVADHGADAHPAVAERLDLVEPELVDVHHAGGPHDVELHQVQQRRAAGQEDRVAAVRIQRDRLLDIGGARVFEVAHQTFLRILPRASWMAVTMFLYAPQRQMLPLIASRTAASSAGIRLSCRMPTALIICPAVQ